MQATSPAPWSGIPGPLASLLGIRHLERDYSKLAHVQGCDEFLEGILAALGVRTEIAGLERSRIPRSGPLVIVANHPFGAIEGLALAHLLRRSRPDIKVLANRFLGRIPQLRPLFFLVDSFGGESGHRQSQAGLRAASGWLAEGKALLCFPAGTVSHLHARERCVRDPEWNEAPARLAMRHRARVLPIWIEGRNSNFFQAAGLVSPILRTLLLPRELDKCRGKTLRVEMGQPVTPEELSSASDSRHATDYLRLRCELMKGRNANRPLSVTAGCGALPVAEPADPRDLRTEIAALEHGEGLLFENSSFQVFAARARAIPNLFHEIARLREATFRAVGEGTGQALDRDRFDEHYTHLVLWDRERAQLAGSYRLAATDEVLPIHGREGLYTATLFHYDAEFFSELGPAWELGRSFVRGEYQRSFWPLLALWKGIARLVLRDPRRTKLFGAASMSAHYSPAARALVTTWLREHRSPAVHRRFVRAKAPPAPCQHARQFQGRLVSDADLGVLVSELEADGKGLPVLLREYLRLGAHVADLHVDRSFGNTLDALVIIDLFRADARLLSRYFEVDGVATLYGASGRQCPAELRVSAPCSRASC